MNKFFRFLMISLFIVGFPAVSWYYLNEGYQYRMAVIAELAEPLGELPSFQFINQRDQQINKKDIGRRIVIANFVSLAEIGQSKPYIDKLYKIQDQFDKKDDILFYTYIKAASSQEVRTYVKSLNIKEEKRWNFLTSDEQQMEQFIQAFPFPSGIKKIYTGNSTVAIADTSSIIRHFYDMNKEEEASKLIVHIANLMPQAPPEEARMKRELEK